MFLCFSTSWEIHINSRKQTHKWTEKKKHSDIWSSIPVPKTVHKGELARCSEYCRLMEWSQVQILTKTCCDTWPGRMAISPACVFNLVCVPTPPCITCYSATLQPTHYTTLHYTLLHYTTLHYTTLHFTTLHYTPQCTVCWLVGCVKSQQGTDKLRQCYVLPHWDRSCRSHFQSHPVTVYWHRANQSQHWPYNARRLAGSHWSANF